MLARNALDRFLHDVCAARAAADVDALDKIFPDDVTLQIVGLGDKLAGKAAVMPALRRLIEDFHFVEWRPIQVVAEGDAVAMRCALKVRHRSKQRAEETETADFITLKDGKIASYVQYADTRLATEMSAAS